jgi:hypothetical protein
MLSGLEGVLRIIGAANWARANWKDGWAIQISDREME